MKQVLAGAQDRTGHGDWYESAVRGVENWLNLSAGEEEAEQLTMAGLDTPSSFVPLLHHLLYPIDFS